MAYTAIQIEGGLFPADLLDAIATGDAPGQSAESFNLPTGTRLTDAIQLAFSDTATYWESFGARLRRSAESSTTLTREQWIIPLFETLGVTLTFQRAALPVGDDAFVISHLAGSEADAPPVHIVAYEQSLDRRAEGSRRSPHATVQEYLNRSDAVWGIVTNGEHLRLLRDAQALARPTYIDIDLRAMVEGNLYSEFVVLFRLLHHTHLLDRPEESGNWLEQYYLDGIAVGGRVREHLRDGVEAALRRLGTAFLSHPDSGALRAAIASGDLDATGYYRELLRLIYRFLFLMVVEERKLLFMQGGDPEEALARQDIYTRYYAMGGLRERCERRFQDDGYADLWEGTKQAFLLFRDEDRAQALGLSALNGELFGGGACAHIEGAHCANVHLLTAIFHISSFHDGNIRRRVNYAALDVEELGSVYESLLDFHPLVELDPAPRFDLVTGSERKQTGSYYTPPSLVAELIKSALAPVIADRLAAAGSWQDKEQALLDLRVVDPASGSGHFLLAAARTIARELARVRNDGDEPSPEGYRRALRDVVRSCIYAVDKNPLAVDLCKVALWIEGYNAGMPLSFLDNHIKNGDTLVGVRDLDVLSEGIPDEAYAAVTGDTKALASDYRKRNKQEREGQRSLLQAEPVADLQELARLYRQLGLAEERTPYEVHQKEAAYQRLRAEGGDWNRDKETCDLWTAAFFMPLRHGAAPVPTTEDVRSHAREPRATHGQMLNEAVGLSATQHFFHWPLEFPDVFARGGFDVVLGNPPWERIKLQEEEFFAARDSEIARAPNKAARGRLIRALVEGDPDLHHQFQGAVHAAEATSKFIRGSGKFPLCGRGDVNTYSVFAELNRGLVRTRGRAGCIVPSGIATDDTTKYFFRDLMDRRSLVSLFDFENREAIFQGVHRGYKFCLLTVASADAAPTADFAFFLTNTQQLQDAERRFQLTADDMELLNPNTRTCPIFRSRRDAELTRAIYRRVPVLTNQERPLENSWKVRIRQGLFHATSEIHLFKSQTELRDAHLREESNIFTGETGRYLPVYNGKMLQAWDHRAADVVTVATNLIRPGQPRALSSTDHADTRRYPQPQYWVSEWDLIRRLQGLWQREWLLGWKDVGSVTNERTLIAAVFPRVPTDLTIRVVFPQQDTRKSSCLAACLNATVTDYLIRQKLGGNHLSDYITWQLPILPPSVYDQAADWCVETVLCDWIAARVLELTYTAWDMQPFACDLDYDGPPFPWDEERRFILRCELDAAFFHLYGIARDDVDYIMDTFPIVKRKDEKEWTEFRTKRVILEVYDRMDAAMHTGKPYDPAAQSAGAGIAG